ncbi:uncharacterized protein LOC126892544 [Diabrotica virgifera virgifera]|uniref:Uncharacterized protein LOC114339908 n=1 Tax=Diabrotica virgifera virgifera TaxID=50390 RepID=A0A6P7GKA8_DIAVI|nr:uncharacterized protein LOC126890753 [Diabrotica virgifera virgifera]XP_050518061.1 uncharacterized protein LOC126892544 [Diabrotica virgifera virgifera]
MEDILEQAILLEANDDDIEYVILNHILNDGNDNNVQNVPVFNFDTLEAEQAKKYFRFEKQDIPRLVQLLGIPDIIVTETGHTCTGLDGLCILLRRLAYPNRLSDLKVIFGLSAQSLSQIINKTVNLILEGHRSILEDLDNVPWLTQEKLEYYSQAVAAKGAAVQNCWGFIDGTARRICRPSINQEAYYSGHKRWHCLKYQSVVCPDGIIISLKGPYLGRRHDAGIFEESNIYMELERKCTFGNVNFVLYGDQAYPLSNLLLCPYPNPARLPNGIQRLRQENFNNSMCQVRLAVEWGFAKIVREFAFLDFHKNQKLLLQDLGKMYKCAVLLINCHTCLYGNQAATYFNVIPPNLETYLEH